MVAFIVAIIALIGCNDKPEVQPVNYQVLNIYPNPATNSATIAVGSQVKQPFTLRVFNTTGKIILEKQGSTGQQNYAINLADELKGRCQVKLKTADLETTQILLKL